MRAMMRVLGWDVNWLKRGRRPLNSLRAWRVGLRATVTVGATIEYGGFSRHSGDSRSPESLVDSVTVL